MNPNRPAIAPRRPRPAGRTIRALLTLSALCAGALGCEFGSPPASDPVEGLPVLREVLDAWKAGEAPEALAGRTPPIHVTDDDWISGLRLQEYEVADAGTQIGTDLNYKVVLHLKPARGAAIKRAAVYTVTTRPQRLVLRQDDP